MCTHDICFVEEYMSNKKNVFLGMLIVLSNLNQGISPYNKGNKDIFFR